MRQKIKVEKWLSRNVSVDGNPIGLAVVIINEDGSARVERFEREEAGIAFTDREIRLEQDANGRLRARFSGTHSPF